MCSKTDSDPANVASSTNEAGADTAGSEAGGAERIRGGGGPSSAGRSEDPMVQSDHALALQLQVAINEEATEHDQLALDAADRSPTDLIEE